MSAGQADATRLWLSLYLPRLPPEVAGERSALHGLAVAAYRFTPAVSVDPCGALLLEIAGSSHLFGGPAGLRASVTAELTRRGHAVVAAIAPTARAALWLACCGREVLISDPARLPDALARLPLQLPGWSADTLRSLHRSGIRRLGECMRLPRAGLARRIGQAVLVEIDEALGRRPEVRQMLHRAGGFRDELELPAETRDRQLLLQALQILLSRLAQHLRTRQAGAWILWMHLRHAAAPATLLRIGLSRPSTDVGHMTHLVALHLSGLSLPAPVLSMRLDVDVVPLSPAAPGSLFVPLADQRESLTVLLDRLRARLGAESVHGIRGCCEHRPEYAWRVVADPAGCSPGHDDEALSVDAARPLWLLEPPVALRARAQLPLFHGPVTFEAGPERIEAGWWDGCDVRRDYHVAHNSRGMRLWIFRDGSGAWYLHGLFG